MPVMLEKTYRALIAAHVPEDQAADAAAELAGYEDHFVKIETRLVQMDGRLNLLTWMVGFNMALSVAILFKVFGR
jgi:hypothetical protein